MSKTTSATTASKTLNRNVIPSPSFRKAIPENILRELQAMGRADNWHNLLYIGFDWLVICGAIFLCLAFRFYWLVYLLSVISIGTRQRALMNLLHQASHKRLFHNKKLNYVLGRLFIGFPLMLSLSSYEASHLLHHAYLWDRDIDPKAMRYDELDLLSPTRHLPTFVVRHLLAPLFLIHVPANLIAAFSWHNEKHWETWCRYGFWTVIVVACIFTGIWPLLIFFWVIPYCTAFQVIRYVADMIDHAGLESHDPWLSTRTWEGSWIMRLILAPHNDNYHLTHHLFPLIPHYRFAKAHRLLMCVPQYANGHHCHNFFWSLRPATVSVIEDILAPERIYMQKTMVTLET